MECQLMECGVFSVLQQSGRNPSRRMISEHWRGRSIDFDDFCEICSQIPQTSVKDLLKAFKRVDRNGDGFISNSELQRMLTSVKRYIALSPL